MRDRGPLVVVISVRLLDKTIAGRGLDEGYANVAAYLTQLDDFLVREILNCYLSAPIPAFLAS